MNLFSALKQTIQIATPLIISRLVNTMTLFLSMLLIAKLGQTELAAGGLVSGIWPTLFVTLLSMFYSVGVVSAHAYGAGKKEELGKILRSGWVLGILLSLPIMLLMWHITPILELAGQQRNLAILAGNYFKGLTGAILPGTLGLCCLQFLISIKKPQFVLYRSIICLIITIIPGYALLFGKWGLPKLGMIGMAYTYTLSSWIALLATILYLLQPKFQIYKLFEFRKCINFFYIKQLFKIGSPISIQFGAELSAFSLTTIFCGWFGHTALAAWQIFIQLSMLILMIPYGLAQASGILIGQAIGQEKKADTRVFGHAGLLIGMGFMIIFALLYLFEPKILMSLYLNVHAAVNTPIMHIAVPLMAIVAFGQLFDGIRNITTSALRGFHDTRVPMFVGILAVWIIGVPLGYLCGFPLRMGPVGLEMGFLLGALLGSFILLKRFYKMTNVSVRYYAK